MDGGHYVPLSRPIDLADRLDAYADSLVFRRDTAVPWAHAEEGWDRTV
jgi:hypothetical protein